MNELKLNDMIVQCVNDSSRWFPGEAQELPNLVLCMAGEVGEVANLVKKVVRGSISIEDAMSEAIMGIDGKSTLQEEIIDVLIYLCNLMGAKEFQNVDWQALWNRKREFNNNRFTKPILNHHDSDRWTGGDRKDEL